MAPALGLYDSQEPGSVTYLRQTYWCCGRPRRKLDSEEANGFHAQMHPRLNPCPCGFRCTRARKYFSLSLKFTVAEEIDLRTIADESLCEANRTRSIMRSLSSADVSQPCSNFGPASRCVLCASCGGVGVNPCVDYGRMKLSDFVVGVRSVNLAGMPRKFHSDLWSNTRIR